MVGSLIRHPRKIIALIDVSSRFLAHLLERILEWKLRIRNIFHHKKPAKLSCVCLYVCVCVCCRVRASID